MPYMFLKTLNFGTPIFFTHSKEKNSCDAGDDDDPDDNHQGDREEGVYEAGNDDNAYNDDPNDDDDPSDDNPHDQGDTEERVYEGGKLHGTATFTSHTGDREERLSPQLYQPDIFWFSSMKCKETSEFYSDWCRWLSMFQPKVLRVGPAGRDGQILLHKRGCGVENVRKWGIAGIIVWSQRNSDFANFRELLWNKALLEKWRRGTMLMANLMERWWKQKKSFEEKTNFTLTLVTSMNHSGNGDLLWQQQRAAHIQGEQEMLIQSG